MFYFSLGIKIFDNINLGLPGSRLAFTLFIIIKQIWFFYFNDVHLILTTKSLVCLGLGVMSFRFRNYENNPWFYQICMWMRLWKHERSRRDHGKFPTSACAVGTWVPNVRRIVVRCRVLCAQLCVQDCNDALCLCNFLIQVLDHPSRTCYVDCIRHNHNCLWLPIQLLTLSPYVGSFLICPRNNTRD